MALKLTPEQNKRFEKLLYMSNRKINMRSRIPPEKISDIKRMIDEGHGTNKIARDLHCGEETVRKVSSGYYDSVSL